MNSRIEDQTETIILKLRPSIMAIIAGPGGVILFGSIAFTLINSLLTGNYTTTNGENGSGLISFVIVWIFIGVLVVLASYSFWSLIGIRSIVLTDKSFIIKRPLLLFKQRIPLNSIETIEEKPYKSKIMYTTRFRAGFDTAAIYNGVKIILELKDSKKIELKSEYFSGLEKLQGALRKLRELKKIK